MKHVQWVLRFRSYMFIMFIFWIFSLPKWISETPCLSCSAAWLEIGITGCNVLLLKSGFAVLSNGNGHACDLENSSNFGARLAKYMFCWRSSWRIYLFGTETCRNWKQMYKLFLWHISSFNTLPVAVVPLGSHSRPWCSVAACNIETYNQQLKKISRFLWG